MTANTLLSKQTSNPFFEKQLCSGHFVLHKGFKNKTVWGTRESGDEKKNWTKLNGFNVITT